MWARLASVALLATIPEGLDAEHQQKKQMLAALSGYSFDTAYIHSQIKDHEKTETLFETEASNGKEQRLINYANNLYHIFARICKKADCVATVLDALQGD
ncbi:DUF4142 domain-containing protein [Ohtaekwangia koreensis]|uniref:DUF4142 domain-containing protein n=1 Tax=Ohtaekwangia koreensis TaxID=688867 RepID=UPI00135655BA|nr:DUF4142 domain-containing protein [Ohtaekwangia koreensis]